MKFKFILSMICLLLLWRIIPAVAQEKPHTQIIIHSHLENRHGARQLIVAGKPFTMISGELHNSTSSAPAYFDKAMKNVLKMNVNSVIASVSWEQLEREEGRYDFTILDHIIKSAHDHQLKVALIWFASWKNGESSYMPIWAKIDTKRFFRIKDKAGNDMSAVSPFCEAAKKADAKAFTAMMRHINLKNQYNDVVMIQVENEVGAFSDIDHGKEAQALYHAVVPAGLTSYLQQHKNELDEYVKDAWARNGAKIYGTWAELFGEDSLVAQHLFMTWYYARYINAVCKLGKGAYNLPMYVNAWQDHSGQLPGKYPNGGPLAKVMDIYRAAAPAIDFIAPDIYLPNYRQICDKYCKLEKNNPLFIPECERTNPGKAFYALGQDDALGFGPFGIESLVADRAYAQSNGVLMEMLPLITRYQGTRHMRGFLQQADEDSVVMDIGKYHIIVKYIGIDKRSYGVILQTGEQDYLIAGMNCRITFSSLHPGAMAVIGEVLEGGFRNHKWYTTRQLNGDETWHNHALIVDSRSYVDTLNSGGKDMVQVLAPVAVLDERLEPGLEAKTISAPAIYKVKIYDAFKLGN